MIKLRKEVKVGIFAFITLAALYWGVNFLRGQDLFRLNKTYYAAYEQVNGMQNSSAIKVKGYKIGVVSKIIYEPEKSDKVWVELNIKSKYRIPEDSKALITSDGLVGGKAIVLEFGSSGKYLNDGDTIRSAQDKDFLEMAGSELEYFKQKASILVNSMSTLLNNVNDLVDSNSDNLSKSIAGIADITTKLSEQVLSEEKGLADLIKNMNEFTMALKGNSDRIESIVSNVEEFSGSLKNADIAGLINSLAGSFEEFQTALEKINNGEGNVGHFLNDTQLYDSLVAVSANLARLLDDLKAHPEKYINVSVFGSKK